MENTMSKTVEQAVAHLETAIAPLERIIELFTASLEPPKLYDFGTDRGYRYDSPDVRHFCLLKAVRVVSALNGSIALIRGGYIQEFAVLVRTLIECTTHIEFVLDPDPSEDHRSLAKKYISDFF